MTRIRKTLTPIPKNSLNLVNKRSFRPLLISLDMRNLDGSQKGAAADIGSPDQLATRKNSLDKVSIEFKEHSFSFIFT